MNAYPESPAFERLKTVLLTAFVEIGADPFAGRRAYNLLCGAGLQEVDVRVYTARARSHDELENFLPQAVHSVRAKILELGLMDEAEIDATIAACRADLAVPDTLSTGSTDFQAWGRKPV